MSSCTKRILAVLLTAVMMISLLAGCGDKKTDTTKEDTKKEDTTTPSGSGSAGSDAPVNAEHPYWLTDEKITLTVTTMDGANNNFEPPNNDDPFWQWMEEQTNVHIEWDIIPNAGYNEVIQTRLAAGTDLSDIINVYNVNNGRNAGQTGILVDMNEYRDCLPNLLKYFEANPSYEPAVTTGAGEIFTINTVSEPVEGHRFLMYNKLWMDKLGLEIPKTLEDFEKVLYAMKAAGDLNGNGKDDEIILTSQGIRGLNTVIGNAYGMENYYWWNPFQPDANGKVWHEETSDNMRAMLSFENKLYEDGILDPEISSMSANKLSEKVASDRVGVFVYYSAFSFSYGGLTSWANGDDTIEIYSLGDALASKWNNNTGFFVKNVSASGQPTGVNAESEYVEIAIRWLDFLFANTDAVYRRTLGIEGEDYKLNADGSVEYIYPTDGTEWDGSGHNAGQLTLPYQQTKDQLLVTKYLYPWYLEQYDYMRETYEFRDPSVPRVSFYTEEEQDIIDLYKTDFNAYMNEMQAKFISGQVDVDSDAEWNAFLKNADKLGLPEITKVHQAVYDRLG